MSSVLDYINTNSLPAKTWLDATPGNINISGTTFTWQNKLSNPNYNFTQSVISRHPSQSQQGITFTGNQAINCNDITLLDTSSYTLIALSKNTLTLEQTLISFRQLLNSGIDLLKYSLALNKLNQLYQRIYLQTELDFTDSLIEEVNILAINHDVKLARSEIRIDNNPYEFRKNIINSYNIEISNSIIGNDDLVNLYHFLLFSPKIDKIHIDNLITLLINSTPELNPNPFWDDITTELWNELNESIWNNIQ